MTGSAQRPEKPESRDGCVSRMLSLQLQKSPTPDFEEKCGNSPDISKGISQLGIYKFESSEVSQPVRRLETLPSITSEKPANGWLLRIGYRSPGSEIGRCGSEIADSLRRIFEIFPFSGDSDRRLGSIRTAWRSLQWNIANSPPRPPANWECRACTAARVPRGPAGNANSRSGVSS
jgi:hypothetical protein